MLTAVNAIRNYPIIFIIFIKFWHVFGTSGNLKIAAAQLFGVHLSENKHFFVVTKCN